MSAAGRVCRATCVSCRPARLLLARGALHSTGARAEGVRPSRVRRGVDGGLSETNQRRARTRVTTARLHQTPAVCVSAAVASAAAGERLREPAAAGVRAVGATLGVASVCKVVNYLTRLETRIAEFSVAASQWARNPEAQ